MIIQYNLQQILIRVSNSYLPLVLEKMFRLQAVNSLSKSQSLVVSINYNFSCFFPLCDLPFPKSFLLAGQCSPVWWNRIFEILLRSNTSLTAKDQEILPVTRCGIFFQSTLRLEQHVYQPFPRTPFFRVCASVIHLGFSESNYINYAGLQFRTKEI